MSNQPKASLKTYLNSKHKQKKSTRNSSNYSLENNESSRVQSTQNTVSKIKCKCKVDVSKLKKYTDHSLLPKSTEFAPIADLSLGQTRAVHAIKTAFEISATGYNIFAVGENGLGKRTFIIKYLQKYGHKQGVVFDWVYAYNFHNPQNPILLALPANSALKIQKALIDIWQTLLNALNQFAHHQQFVQQQQTVKAEGNTGNPKVLTNSIQTLKPHYNDEHSYKKITEQVIAPLFKDLIEKYSDNSKLHRYLTAMQQDIVDHAIAISSKDDARFLVNNQSLVPDRYCLNILVNHSKESPEPDRFSSDSAETMSLQIYRTSDDAPIVFEPYPKLSNLLGHISQTMQSGSTFSNHMMIQSSALLQANGGYLLIEASHLAEHPEAWNALKRALQLRMVDLSNYRQTNDLIGIALKPEPIPLNLKVILLGDPELYDQFSDIDSEFNATFKIRADFHDEVARIHENEIAMISKMADIIEKYQLKHFDNTAQAVVLDYLSLQCEDQNKLSLHTDRLIQLMLESNRHAEITGSDLVNAKHIKQALADMVYRSGYLKELYLQEITDGQQLISTTGKAVGQINALTIVDYANSEFGMPALLTAVVQHSMGSGDILDIERDVELGGSLHAKGMLIMNSYLRALFSPYHPLNFTASLAFEQSYAHIDGDSATLAEACALLSALADTPISQSLAITGSMNQLGRVQAVGGINAKVAGFFDACSHQGLSGNQGVILPYANISQLMLRDDIIEAIKSDKFHIYGVNTLSEALTILAEIPVDTMTRKGHYRKSSLFGKIIKNLKKWEEQLNPPEEDTGS